jgi:DNA-binding transcriptional LysR family regulator
VPKFHHLRDFVAIARSQSARSAARTLGLTQPALTRSLQELEQELGTALFERHARGMTLTSAGERFLVRAQAALEEVRRGFEEAGQARGLMTGQVTVALASAPVLALLPSAYRDFRRQCPQVKLRIVEGLFPAVEPALRDGRLDFYLGPRPERSLGQGYRVDLIFHNERVVLARPGHPLRRQTGPCQLADLVEAEWIVTGLRERLEQEFEEQFHALGLASPPVVTVVESMLALLALLNSSDALAFLPRQWADTALLRGLVEPIAVIEPLLAPDIVQVSRAKLPLTPAAEQLAVLMLRAAGPTDVRSAVTAN